MRLKLLPLLCLQAAAALATEALAADPVRTDEITVTGTREGERVAETAAAVSVVKADALREARPRHPAEILGQVPGVWVNVTSGEGHTTAIRQPLTTSPVYLYLEDGIPVRSTGFFNHNALYEVNLPQAGGIEVAKGPGSALYGSDAIGGVVNVLTRPAPLKPEAELMAEAGDYGWQRLLASGGNTVGDDGWRGDLNLTHTDGWRDHSAYDRQAATLRWDRVVGGEALLKTVLSHADIDQELGASSTVSTADYYNRPSANYTPIAFRKVQALRLSSAYEHESGDTLLSITPYYRQNTMDLLPAWSLSYDPTVYNTANQSFGVMAKVRRDFEPMRARLIAGVDVDYSPGGREEDRINATKVGGVYTSYTVAKRIYDYDVSYRGVSPYVHGELSPVERLRLTAGLRHDDMRYRYDNHLAATAIQAVKWYGQVADTDVGYQHWSPKLGATWAFSERVNGFANYNHAFRAPSESQLFRPSAQSDAIKAQAAALAALGLKPVKADSAEIGLRGQAGATVGWELSYYHLSKRDDIVSYKDPATGASTSVNAGETLHQGIEAGLKVALTERLSLDVAASYAKHRYESWVASGTDFSGKEMSAAPRLIANTRLGYALPALNGGRLSLEWVRIGPYWIDDANTAKYDGHNLINLRINAYLDKEWEAFASLMNLTGQRYAESTKLTGANIEYSPGMPRAAYVGLRYLWGK